jgi:hypothetical protein
MTTTRRTVSALAALALAGVGLLGLTACDAAQPLSDGPAVDAAALDLAASLGVEEQALAALGFAPAELAAQAEPSASPDADKRDRRDRRPLRRELLRGRVLHAEAVVQTKEGVKTLLSQRGTITAIDGDSMTVKSTDGFTLTWTFGENLRVVDRRRTVQPTDLAAGAEVGVAGTKDGDQGVAGLIVRRAKD